MKLIYKLSIALFFIANFLLIESIRATDFAIAFNVSHYQGGNNISCFGAQDGMVEAVIVGGTPPYSYSWNTGSYNRVLTGKGAGVYTFTVTDASSQTISAEVELMQPAALGLLLWPEFYGGYNISQQGGHDGVIQAEPTGGTMPYSYAWSTSSTAVKIQELIAGTYSLVLTDANGCTVGGSQTLTEPTPLHVVNITSPQHHGYNISCKGGTDGLIDLSVTGGVPPYKFDWNTGSFEEDINDLVAGEYTVRITDDNHAEVVASIILTQPAGSLKVTFIPQVYSNGFNLSCHDCANGSLTAVGNSGVSPYTFLWSNSQTVSTISGLQAIQYSCTISDLNGCTNTESFILSAPDRDDWSMNGNANVNPASQFMGTTDNKDFLIKTNNTERIKVSGNGKVTIHGTIKLDSLSSDSVNAAFVDQNGNLRVSSTSSSFCNQPAFAFYKKSCPSDPKFYLYGGNGSAARLVLGNPATTPGNYRMYVTNGILTDRVRIADPNTSFWADYVFDKEYKLQSLQEVKEFISENKHLPNIPTTKEVKENGIDVLEIQSKLLEKIEELTLHLISQEERIKELEGKISANEK